MKHILVCFICKRSRCWSTRYIAEEQDKANADFKARMKQSNRRYDESRSQQYITDIEGEDPEVGDTNIDQYVQDQESDSLDDHNTDNSSNCFVTSFSDSDGHALITQLSDFAI